MLRANHRPQKTKLRIDGRAYTVQVLQRVIQPKEAPRLVVVAYQPNTLTQGILRACLQAVQHFTPEPHELWVVDNNSPWSNVIWLLDCPGINLVLNRTEPLEQDDRGFLRRLVGKRLQSGSYANAIGLELGVRCIDPEAQCLMTLHMDIMPCHLGWLSFLRSKLNEGVRGAGVRMDKARTPEGVLHILGCLVDFQLFRSLELDFLPRLPQFDVGDRVTVGLREAGYQVFACSNTLWEPKLVETVPASSPLRKLRVDRSFDDNGNVIFLHLGRGVRKSSANQAAETTPEEWIRFAEGQLLS